MTSARIFNHTTISLRDVPVLPWNEFAGEAVSLLSSESNHCVAYFGCREKSDIRIIMVIADDQSHNLVLLSHLMAGHEAMSLPSLTADHFALHIFEREIHENLGIHFSGHPWQKPVRYAFNRADRSQVINNYPFYQIGGGELHQVGVGPIHAGVIEPGHFRFLCSGETVLHLEIQLGWQHRGVESLFLQKPGLLQRTVLSESIAGDTAIGHSLAFVMLMESLGNQTLSENLETERIIALELERIAMHVGDLSNMNIGLAYQLGASVFGTLRTPVINFMQTWCGNRFGKGLNRVGGSHYPLNQALRDKLSALLNHFEEAYIPMADRMFSLPSVLGRLENIGKISDRQARLIGAVGMTARMAGIERDVRQSHPFSAYLRHSPESCVLVTGDVFARARLRDLEIRASISFIRELLQAAPQPVSSPTPASHLKLAPDSICVSLTEGWRGEICHTALTNADGQIRHYAVQDPSIHNWFALALSLRNLEISDFPINNKSYNLSYCGHDL